MYVLTCPNCGHILSGSFVRVGAVVSCPSCRQRYQIREQDVVRRIEPQPDQPEQPERAGGTPGGSQEEAQAGGASGGEPQAEAGQSSGDTRRRVDEAGQVIGLTGLTQMMRHEEARRPAPVRETSAQAPAPPPPKPPSPVHSDPSAPPSPSGGTSRRRGSRLGRAMNRMGRLFRPGRRGR